MSSINARGTPKQSEITLLGKQKERVGIDVSFTLPTTFDVGVSDLNLTSTS